MTLSSASRSIPLAAAQRGFWRGVLGGQRACRPRTRCRRLPRRAGFGALHEGRDTKSSPSHWRSRSAGFGDATRGGSRGLAGLDVDLAGFRVARGSGRAWGTRRKWQGIENHGRCSRHWISADCKPSALKRVGDADKNGREQRPGDLLGVLGVGARREGRGDAIGAVAGAGDEAGANAVAWRSSAGGREEAARAKGRALGQAVAPSTPKSKGRPSTGR